MKGRSISSRGESPRRGRDWKAHSIDRTNSVISWHGKAPIGGTSRERCGRIWKFARERPAGHYLVQQDDDSENKGLIWKITIVTHSALGNSSATLILLVHKLG